MEKGHLILQLLHPYTFIPAYTVIREMRVGEKDALIFEIRQSFSGFWGPSQCKFWKIVKSNFLSVLLIIIIYYYSFWNFWDRMEGKNSAGETISRNTNAPRKVI